MKKIIFFLLFLFAGFVVIAQTVEEPAPAATTGGSSVWTKIAIAVAAIAIMALIFYIGKRLNKKT